MHAKPTRCYFLLTDFFKNPTVWKLESALKWLPKWASWPLFLSWTVSPSAEVHFADQSPFCRSEGLTPICNRTFFFPPVVIVHHGFFCIKSFLKKKLGGPCLRHGRAEFRKRRWKLRPLPWKQGALSVQPPRESLKQDSHRKICVAPLFSWAPKHHKWWLQPWN